MQALLDNLKQNLDNSLPKKDAKQKLVSKFRSLAFYYLARKELSKQQLHQKLMDKQCPKDIADAIVDEFAQKNYQSDTRAANMIVRENIRKSRGRSSIKRALKSAGLSLALDDLDVDEFIDGTVLQDDADDAQKSIDWLKLAVHARCQKYGNNIPTCPKQKARQLRFLQYRGFENSTCFSALKYTLEDFN